jgi:patatin-like phospholipase/acyl hydrolase
MAFRILSLDGGGIRGIIPAIVLAELERRTGRPAWTLFDLIAGTSTGGILALGLTKRKGRTKKAQFRAADLVTLYEEDGPRIFQRSVWHRVRSMGGVSEEKYPSHGVEGVLEEKFGAARLSEALVPVLVPAYDIEMRHPHFFKSQDAAKKPDTKDFLMRDAARATSAAPTYFEPARVQPLGGGDQVSLVDGGVYANNPAACALVECICDFNANPTDVVMLSLGTGELTRPIFHEEAKDWGLAKWAQPVLNVVFDGVSDTVDYQVGNILKSLSGESSYLRMQTQLHEGNDDMDDAGSTNLRVLKLLAKELIRQHDEKLDEMAARLTSAEAPSPKGS